MVTAMVTTSSATQQITTRIIIFQKNGKLRFFCFFTGIPPKKVESHSYLHIIPNNASVSTLQGEPSCPSAIPVLFFPW